MLIQITAPHFVAGYDTQSGRIAPIIRYMRGWPLEKIAGYCKQKGWNVTVGESDETTRLPLL